LREKDLITEEEEQKNGHLNIVGMVGSIDNGKIIISKNSLLTKIKEKIFCY
jgi:hypothetical protein